MTLRELIEKLQAAIASGIDGDVEVRRLGNVPNPADAKIIRVGDSVDIMALKD